MSLHTYMLWCQVSSSPSAPRTVSSSHKIISKNVYWWCGKNFGAARWVKFSFARTRSTEVLFSGPSRKDWVVHSLQPHSNPHTQTLWSGSCLPSLVVFAPPELKIGSISYFCKGSFLLGLSWRVEPSCCKWVHASSSGPFITCQNLSKLWHKI